MPSTQRRITVELQELAHAIVEQLLEVRDIDLKHRAPKCDYTHQLRRDIKRGQVIPVHMLLALSFADLDDGASFSRVAGPYETAIALLKEHARHRDAERGGRLSPSLLPVIVREMRREAIEREDEARVIADENSPAALRQLLRDSALERETQDRRDGEIRDKLAFLETSAARHVHQVA